MELGAPHPPPLMVGGYQRCASQTDLLVGLRASYQVVSEGIAACKSVSMRLQLGGG